MCNICGCSIDPAAGSLYEKHFNFINCGNAFNGSGVVVVCPSCRSRKIKRVK